MDDSGAYGQSIEKAHYGDTGTFHSLAGNVESNRQAPGQIDCGY